MKKFVVAGPSTYGVKNAGDDAMLRNLVDGLRGHFPDSDIILLARHPDPDFDREFGVHSIKNVDHDSKRESRGRWFRGFNAGDPTDHLASIRHAIEECDLLIIGGNSFMEISANEFLRGVASYVALLVEWAKFLQTPYMLYGVEAHPISDPMTRQLTRFIVDNSELVTVREHASREQLLKAGADDRRIKVLADPAFGLQPARDRKLAMDLLRSEGITFRSDHVVGIGFRHMYWQWGPTETEQYTRKMAALCDSVIDRTGADLLFIPNCTYDVDTQNEDDRVMARAIRREMKNPRRTFLIEGDYLLSKTLAFYTVLDAFISNRRHACIFAALHEVPFVALSTGYMWHFTPFVEALSMPNQAINFIDEPLDALGACVERTWEDRRALSRTLASALPELRTRAHQHTVEIANLVNGGGAA